MINNAKNSVSFDTKKIGIISAMLWFLISIVGSHVLFSLLFFKSHVYYNYLFADIEYFRLSFGAIVSILLVSYYYSSSLNTKLKILIKYLLKIIFLLFFLKMAIYILKIYFNIYIPIYLFDLSNGIFGYIFLMAMFFKLSELRNNKIQLPYKLKTILLSFVAWFLISYPLYWASHTFITPDYFVYPIDYEHFRELNIFIYTIGALISIPISIHFNFRDNICRDNILKEYCKILFTHSSILDMLALVFFALFTYYDHHVSSIGSIISLVFFFSLIGIFDKYAKTNE